MSGHSKWATIKHAKGAADAKRGKMFSRLAKEIMIVAKSGGDPNTNPSLRNLIAKAKSINMPKDNIDRAIKKGTGELQAEVLEEITYEGYAGTVGLVVQVLTDNKNRAAAEIRNIFKKNGSELGQSGSVTRNFERKGQILLPKGDLNEDDVMMMALDAGADDVNADDEGFEILTAPSAFTSVCDALNQAGIETADAEVKLMPMATTPVTDVAQAKAINKFIAALEDNEDVQNVYTTADFSDEVEAALAEEE
ncbi:MAG: YebC/PmpR family DNA-binding transcriptional regulator [Kiritimatiellae bacterium]|nr:YebC/PmpR family DNA-binding transcriptional regulator [Kiritimatiellia bacterium]